MYGGNPSRYLESTVVNYLLTQLASAILGNIGSRSFLYGTRFARPQVSIPQCGPYLGRQEILLSGRVRKFPRFPRKNRLCFDHTGTHLSTFKGFCNHSNGDLVTCKGNKCEDMLTRESRPGISPVM